MIKDFLKNKKAVLFDLDGTLVDSMWMWPQIDVEFLGRFGYDCPGDLERAVEGMSFSETAAYFKERFSLPMTLEEIKECWSQMAMDKYRTQVPLKPGALEFLRYCKDQGIATGIATSNGRPIVDAVIEALQIGKMYQYISNIKNYGINIFCQIIIHNCLSFFQECLGILAKNPLLIFMNNISKLCVCGFCKIFRQQSQLHAQLSTADMHMLQFFCIFLDHCRELFLHSD